MQALESAGCAPQPHIVQGLGVTVYIKLQPVHPEQELPCVQRRVAVNCPKYSKRHQKAGAEGVKEVHRPQTVP